MKIIEMPRAYTPFSALKEGDVFKFDGDWYLKMVSCETIMMRINAVCLADGVPIYLEPETAIEYRDVEFKVEEV